VGRARILGDLTPFRAGVAGVGAAIHVGVYVKNHGDDDEYNQHAVILHRPHGQAELFGHVGKASISRAVEAGEHAADISEPAEHNALEKYLWRAADDDTVAAPASGAAAQAE
jgi:hypothetical protein